MTHRALSITTNTTEGSAINGGHMFLFGEGHTDESQTKIYCLGTNLVSSCLKNDILELLMVSLLINGHGKTPRMYFPGYMKFLV